MSRPRRSQAALAVLVLLAAGAPPLAPAAQASPPAAAFALFPAPSHLGQDGAEPSIGVNWATGRAMVQAGLETLRVTFSGSGPSATWESVGADLTSAESLDPILFLDTRTGRTFVSQLLGECSLMAFSDDDGASWFQNPFGCGAGSGADHQSVGGGAFAPGMEGVGYEDTVYYCSHAVGAAQCALSLNGGISFNPAVPIYTALQCGGLHGHLRAAPDGTVYVPNADCNGQQAVVVSQDNGASWSVRKIPGTTTQQESDPSVAVGSGGKVYFCFQDGDGKPKAAASTDKGRTWGPKVDLGVPFGLRNSQFPAVIAGDDDRAACAFLGTPTAGNDQSSAFQGVWHLYVSVTYDGGATWETHLATPHDPVQRGCIWLGGGSNPCRNLLDFNDIALAADGRIYAVFADGCISAACIGPSGTPAQSRADVVTIARQATGRTLFAAYDGGVGPPGAPALTATPAPGKVRLAWTVPADGGAPITSYAVSRGTAPGALAPYATASAPSFEDAAVVVGTTYHYQVAAVNAVGQGNRSNVASAVPLPPVATPPGPPLNLTAAPGPGLGAIGLAWTPPPDDGGSPVTGYAVRRAEAPGASGTVVALLGPGETRFQDAGLPPGVTRWYRVAASNAQGEGPPGNEASATTFAPPSAPRNLTASPGPGSGAITLSWLAPASAGGLGVEAYRVLRGPAGAEILVAEVPGNASGHTEAGHAPGSTHTYRVVARNAAGDGPASNAATATAPSLPGPPRNLTAQPALGFFLSGLSPRGSIALAWQAPASGTAPTGYKVYRLSHGGEAPIATLPATQRTYTDREASAWDPNTYHVVALTAAGEGPRSNGACTGTYPWLPPLDPPGGSCG